jgi:BirA family biotin operon repressor/biotin-[acetyl-CoA-carboxylase] ligase
MSTRFRLIELLADGGFRSGRWLGEQLGISRAAVWKQIQSLSRLGLDVHAVRGQGYRLAIPFQPLNAALIRNTISDPVSARLDGVEVFREIDSTSDYLKRSQAQQHPPRSRVCVAEWQSAGRGRRGRRWVSPYGASLYLSLGLQLNEATLRSGGLSLVAAIAVLRALCDSGVEGLGLKWPNDIYYQQRKLACVLLDLSGESGGPYHVVIGVGINLRLPEAAAREIDQPWADLSRCGCEIDRNRLAGAIVTRLMQAIDVFDKQGLEAFAQEWKRYDLIAGRVVELHDDSEAMISGVARGIDGQGGLVIEQGGITRSYHAGEISVRLA